MRSIYFVVLIAILSACGSSTDTKALRYNFGIVDGANQASTAGSAQLAKPITSQLTRDPQGKFATRVFDFFAPAIAYAQGLVLSGEPVAGAIVCGREARLGEPQIVPLCAFTLSDGRAANAVQPGTKAGKFNILFTAQVPALAPVADSTTVTVTAGPVTDVVVPHLPWNCTRFGQSASCVNVGDAVDFATIIVAARDRFGNDVTDWKITATTGIAVRDGSEPGQPTPDATGTLKYVVEPKWAGRRIYVYFWIGTFRGFDTVDVN